MLWQFTGHPLEVWKTLTVGEREGQLEVETWAQGFCSLAEESISPLNLFSETGYFIFSFGSHKNGGMGWARLWNGKRPLQKFSDYLFQVILWRFSFLSLKITKSHSLASPFPCKVYKVFWWPQVSSSLYHKQAPVLFLRGQLFPLESQDLQHLPSPWLIASFLLWGDIPFSLREHPFTKIIKRRFL